MSTQVFYRKWRPQGFDQVVGQEHVTTTLANAVTHGRVGHSYLFCGPRGTGKTSTARILAKAVNCTGPEEGRPCGSCARCVAVQEGRFMDLIEMDAASNRGIDEVRNIRDKVNLAPVEGRYKVYIIDEAHMLTEHASNAFLKTLEEPPPHVVFILCTTEPHKILPTIISRCQRFDFRRLTSESMLERLRLICDMEGIEADTSALKILAHFSSGSLRDAENLLEQVVVSYSGTVGVNEVNQMLGLGHGQQALELINYLLMGNTPAAVASINRAAWDGVDLRQLHKEAVDLLRSLLLLQCGSKDSLDIPSETSHALEELASRSSINSTMLCLKHLAPVNMKLDSPSPLPLELAVVEISLEGAPREAPEPAPKSRPSSADPSTRTVAPPPRDSRESPVAADTIAEPAKPAPEPPPAQVESPVVEVGTLMPAAPVMSNGSSEGLTGTQWSSLVRALSRYKGKRFNIGALLRGCKNPHLDGDTLVIAFSHKSHLERMQEELDDPQGMRTVEDAMVKSLGTAYRLKLDMTEGAPTALTQGPDQSPLVRAVLNWGGRILEERAE